MRRLLTVGWVAVGAVPVAAGVNMVRSGWTPVIDNALIATMTVDSVSLDPPLVGMPTSLGLGGGAPLSHAGPLGFWLVAIPAKLWGEPGHGLLVGSVMVFLASVAGTAFVLRRRREVALEAVALALVAVLAVALRGIVASPLNPHLGVMPLLLFMLAVWGVLSGHHRQLWIAVLAGSVAAQVHLGYVPLVVGLMGLTALSLVIDVIRSRGARRRRLCRRTIPIGVLLGVFAWIGPILDQLFGTQNLTRLARSQSGGRPTLGVGHGADIAIEMTSVPPRWLLGRAQDQDLSDPSALRTVLSLVTVLLVVGLLVWAWRRSDRALASLTSVSLVAIGLAVFTSARVVNPTDSFFFVVEDAVLYRLFWWPVGTLVTLTVVWGGARAVSAVLASHEVHSALPRWRLPLVGALVAGIVVLVGVTPDSPVDGLDGYLSHEIVNAEAIAKLPGSPGTVVLRFQPEGSAPTEVRAEDQPLDVWDLGPDQRYGYAVNLVAQLRLRGIEVRFAPEPDDGVTFMLAYRNDHPARGDEAAELLYLVGAAALSDPPGGYRRVSLSDEPSVTLVPAAPTAVYLRTKP